MILLYNYITSATRKTRFYCKEKVTADAPNATIGPLTYLNTDTAEVKNGLSSFNKEAEITFETFPHAGLYEYTICETAGTENGITYDTASYNLNGYVCKNV